MGYKWRSSRETQCCQRLRCGNGPVYHALSVTRYNRDCLALGPPLSFVRRRHRIKPQGHGNKNLRIQPQGHENKNLDGYKSAVDSHQPFTLFRTSTENAI
ncbi:hypothetical protein RRG08_032212 [Elysia crispata]|uniref:Uncharacterized protein n=1 Tax=Elysia crispata TaxID=231223 RepID=A0AAE1ABB1_9GAST|nr:hypothetical protein RRG08_032212 [Elysia crispata]